MPHRNSSITPDKLPSNCRLEEHASVDVDNGCKRSRGGAKEVTERMRDSEIE